MVDKAKRRIVVLGGGVSGEREVSLASSKAVFGAIPSEYDKIWVDLKEEALPAALDPEADIIFPVLHGGYGEDGRLQADLEEGGFDYVGCDAKTSRICIQKSLTKQLVSTMAVPVAKDMIFQYSSPPSWKALIDHFESPSLVLKPAAEGSSVGLYAFNSEASWKALLPKLIEGEWLVEERLPGFDVTVGILDDAPLGVIGSHPEGGFYDYEHKYTLGSTRYSVPAELAEDLTNEIRAAALIAFTAAGGRDFARVDFMTDGESFTFLEINTLPGMTETSLLPKSASVFGYNFASLVSSMLTPALKRSKNF
tara:strand:- start:150 stop:1076 length:927 start_codon:yes stop_codon:yes gene_type:complete